MAPAWPGGSCTQLAVGESTSLALLRILLCRGIFRAVKMAAQTHGKETIAAAVY